MPGLLRFGIVARGLLAFLHPAADQPVADLDQQLVDRRVVGK